VNPTATPRLRSIRIEIPREGQAFTFTKVLNAGQTPLSVQIGLMKLRTFQSIQMTLQLSVFLAGILVWWWQWRHNRNTFVLTLALALSLGAVGSLLLAWRLLHLAFIWSAPILVLAVVGWLAWKFWPRARPISALSTGAIPFPITWRREPEVLFCGRSARPPFDERRHRKLMGTGCGRV